MSLAVEVGHVVSHSTCSTILRSQYVADIDHRHTDMRCMYPIKRLSCYYLMCGMVYWYSGLGHPRPTKRDAIDRDGYVWQGAVLAAQSAEARAEAQAIEAQQRLHQASLRDAQQAQVGALPTPHLQS